MTTAEKQSKIAQIKSEVNSPKHRLIDIVRKLEEISPREAGKLNTLIGKLEDWQRQG